MLKNNKQQSLVPWWRWEFNGESKIWGGRGTRVHYQENNVATVDIYIHIFIVCDVCRM